MIGTFDIVLRRCGGLVFAKDAVVSLGEYQFAGLCIVYLGVVSPLVELIDQMGDTPRPFSLLVDLIHGKGLAPGIASMIIVDAHSLIFEVLIECRLLGENNRSKYKNSGNKL
ncbi:MAG: hypothetical protein MAGBODY4_01090 [Candidatus Marinimicrobia bacterium]|nr:hypothetical protein [Candidatus Neomarinimicrobiota bacterium]